jgi:predicted RNA binding protein YcfA (HicA-like mRNA interferase family)
MSRHLPALKPRAVLRALTKAGLFTHHISGSHYTLKHPDRPSLRVTLPFHNRDLKRRTLTSIIEQAGFSTEEFLDLLNTGGNRLERLLSAGQHLLWH